MKAKKYPKNLIQLQEGFKSSSLNKGTLKINLENVYTQLDGIREALKELKREIEKDRLEFFSDEKIEEYLSKFKSQYKKFDEINNYSEESEAIKEESFLKVTIFTKSLAIKLEIQALISRIANKVHREKIQRLEKKLKSEIKEFNNNINKTYTEIKEENSRTRESILTVSSLIFTAFTIIQLNFTAFQNSKDYVVLDRIILFSGINLLMIIGVFGILSLINEVLLKERNQEERRLKGIEIRYVGVMLSLIFVTALVLKYRIEEKNGKILETKIEKLQKDLENIKSVNTNSEFKEEIDKINKRVNYIEKNLNQEILKKDEKEIGIFFD